MREVYLLHKLREKLLSIFPELQEFVAITANSVAQFYIVGGALRDIILGIKPKDIDFVPDKPGAAGEMAKQFVEHIGGVVIEFHSHGDVYRVIHGGRSFDFTELQGGDINADLNRRDFTINSMALRLTDAVDKSKPLEIIDPMRGQADIAGRVVRINNPGVYDDDPLRIMRLFRFAYKLDFRMDDFSYRIIPQKIFGLDRISPERIRDELFELLSFNRTAKALEAMEGVGLLTWLFPALAASKGFPQNDFHHLDVYSHTLAAIEELEDPHLLDDARLIGYRKKMRERLWTRFASGHCILSLMKLAMVLHDIGKPACVTQDESGRLHFIGHEKLSAEMAREYLNDLRLSKREISYILKLIEGHMRPGQIHLESNNLHKQLYRYFKDLGVEGADMAIFSLADRLAAKGPAVTDDMIDREYEICRLLLDTLFNRSQLIAKPPKLMTGRILIEELGIRPGPMVGLLLDGIEEAQLDGSVTTTDGALEYARRLIRVFSEGNPPRK